MSEGLPEILPYKDLSEEPTYTADQLVTVMQINAATRHRHNLDQKFYSKALEVARIKDEEIAQALERIKVLDKTIAELTEELDKEKKFKEIYYRRADKAEAESEARRILLMAVTDKGLAERAEHQKQIREIFQWFLGNSLVLPDRINGEKALEAKYLKEEKDVT